ncbi:hypothetical protein PPACK8108_LOCUS13634 [Phakopsora pachyrhizi]|uniref:Uncharacterized protein n=1 Tax=Phakopsora pachyrhizi TaxID=170000 RepID=A0AAV0B648_PHAPC|nr:hypothetical protein PPACK8108_LOCUS13634 [Phakopsora pachyrhizi]
MVDIYEVFINFEATSIAYLVRLEMSRYLSCARDSSTEWNGIRCKSFTAQLNTVQCRKVLSGTFTNDKSDSSMAIGWDERSSINDLKLIVERETTLSAVPKVKKEPPINPKAGKKKRKSAILFLEKMIIEVMSKFDERMSTVGISDIGISGTEIAMKKSGKCFMPVVNSAILPTEDNVTTLGWWPLKL